MTKILKKALSVVLVFCMIMSMLSMTALADDQTGGEPPVSSSSQPEEETQAPVAEPAPSADPEEENQAPEAGETPEVSEEPQASEESGVPEINVPAVPQPVQPSGSGVSAGDDADDDEFEQYLNTDFYVKVDASAESKEFTFVYRGAGSGELTQGIVRYAVGARMSGTDTGWTVVIGEGITSIGANAFRDYGNIPLTAVTIGADVETIGDGAFGASNSDTNNLTSVVFEGGSSVKTIGGDAFRRCHAAVFTNFPATVETIGHHAFNWCDKLSFDLSECTELTTIGEGAFGHCAFVEVELPASLTALAGWAFEWNTSLVSADLSGCMGLASIGQNAFNACALTYVVFPDCEISIPVAAFNGNNLSNTDRPSVFFVGQIVGTWRNCPSFALNGGVSHKDAPNAPTRDGYTFLGWYSDLNDESTKAMVFENGTTYYAKWQCLHDDTTTTDTATCDKDGYVTVHCNTCGEDISVTESSATGAHAWDDGEMTRSADCTTSGARTYTCTVCGETRTETIPSHGHVWSGYVVTQEPAVGVSGIEASTCSVCGATRTRSIAALSETPVDPEPVDPDPVDSEEPDDDPVDIPDDNPPLSENPNLPEEPDDTDIPDEEPPLSEEPDDMDIPDEEPPLSEEPDIFETPEDSVKPSEAPAQEQQPVQPVQDSEEIDDGEVPLADVPQTGDSLTLWLSAAALSGMGLVAVTVSERKRKEQDAE